MLSPNLGRSEFFSVLVVVRHLAGGKGDRSTGRQEYRAHLLFVVIPHQTQSRSAHQRAAMVDIDRGTPCAIGIHRKVSLQGFLEEVPGDARGLRTAEGACGS